MREGAGLISGLIEFPTFRSNNIMACVIGVDVGGTNTDAVILRGKEMISSCKRETTVDRTQGVVNSIEGCFKNISDEEQMQVKKELKRVCIGTTHFVNAVVERSADKLTPVAVIRLCGPASIGVPPFADFPSDLSKIIKRDVMLLSGGLQYDGTQISPIVKEELESVAKKLLLCDPPVVNVVISGIFSPLDNPDSNQEVQAANIIKNISSQFSFTLASQIGRLGLIERENAAILNESLKPFAVDTIQAFKDALTKLQLTCPFHLTQNDGTLISVDDAVRFPILTFSSGPTNSMRGAMFLTGKKDAIVVDIGGTSTDAGVLVNGFPREASSQVKIGGVRTNFQMPDVPSIALGGGSIIKSDEITNEVKVGPESVGYKLTSKSLCFNGDTCTATDIAIAAGIVKGNIGNTAVTIDSSTTYKAMTTIRNKLEALIDVVKTDKNDVPVLLVGGGSILVDLNAPIKGVSSITVPENYAVANAIGAALGMVSGRSDRIESISQIISTIESKDGKSEDDLNAIARDLAVQKGVAVATKAARSKGSYPGTETIYEKSAVDVTYVPNALRVTVKVVGSLNEPVETDVPSSDDPQVQPIVTDSVNAIDKDNPLWPYCSEHDMKRDESCGLPKPIVDQENGVWTLTKSDVECISIGAGILGCGGGGDPNIGRVIALQLLQQGKKIQMVNPCRIKHSSFGVFVCVACMGAPVILNEKLVNGTEALNCIETMQKLLASGICESSCDYGRKETGNITLTTRKLDNGNTVWVATNLPEVPEEVPLHRKLTGLMCAEVGGFNSFEPLVAGARANLPVLDADGMGRAFPELPMFLPAINGVPVYPSCVADEKGEVIAVTHVSNVNDLESFFRKECVRMGMECAVSMCPVTLDQVLSTCVLFSFSQAWQLGRAVMCASTTKMSVVQAITEQEHGVLLISGKVIDVDRTTSSGFSGSKVIVQGTGSYTTYTVQVVAKNENYIARLLNDDGSTGTILAVTPDLITIIDTDTGYPITTEDIRYGLRVSVLVLPANRQLLTPQALPVVGPGGFGFTDIQYQQPKTINL